MKGSPYNCATLFCGGGGVSLGCKEAGFHELLATDINPAAIRVHRGNLPDVPTLTKDIADVTATECLAIMGLSVGEMDFMQFSTPCQGFSADGKGDFGDPRNRLYQHPVRLIQEIQPKVFMQENVKGLTYRRMRVWLKVMRQDFKACGYTVDAALLDAQEYGVPQRRERVIILGVRNDLGIKPSFPGPIWPPPVIVRLDSVPAKMPEWRSMEILKEGEIAPTFTCHHRFFWNEAEELGPLSYRHVAGFPEDYELNCGHRRGLEFLGNAVPPRMMYHIAMHVRKNILDPVYHAASLAA